MNPGSRQHDLQQRALERHYAALAHDEELARHAPSREASERLARCATTVECFATACALFADRTAFAERARVIEAGAIRPLPSLVYVTYAELWERVRRFASGLHHAGIVRPGTMMGIAGFGSVEWMIADLAALYLAAVAVPLPTGTADLPAILSDAGIEVVAASLEQLPAVAAALPACPSIRAVVVLDVDLRASAHEAALARAKDDIAKVRPIPIFTVAELSARGESEGAVPFADPRATRSEPDPLMTLIYTSGSTGTPKGAMFPESLWRESWRSSWTPDLSPIALVTVNYMPLNHLAGLGAVLRGIMEGGLVSFALASDMSTLFEDLRLARPTALMLVPRAAAMIYQRFQTEVVKRAARDEGADRAAIEADVLREMRAGVLGDRLVHITTTTAPTAPEITWFLERCFDVPVHDGYGSTETGPITFDGKIERSAVTAFKLVDVPELGYRTTDKPYPRGELAVKSTRLVPGYYKNPAAGAALFDEEGYLVTGDIVEQRDADHLVWVDRKKNVLKLAQGEFVSTSRLEELYRARSPFIQQIYLHGNSVRAYLLAVVVPDATAVAAHFAERGITPGRAEVKRLLGAEIDRIAQEASVEGYEVPREILVEDEPFTVENGLLTESKKLSRPRLRARFGARLDELYAEIERTELEELGALARGGERSAAELVHGAIRAALGVTEIDDQRSFLHLGGDSLNAVRVASLLEDLAGVDVPVGFILDPTSTIGAIVRLVGERLSGAAPSDRPSFAALHGAGATSIPASDLRLDRVLPASEITMREAPKGDGAVLLTGANGFLGRFLTLALAERTAARGSKVVCVVRGESDAQAGERLAKAYRGPDPALAQRFAAQASRIEVLAGDLGKPRLGLSEERWSRLADEVSAVVHNGALVNHAFSYRELFEPNVLGTAEVMRLALRGRPKSIAFVSTVGVAMGQLRTTPVREDEDALSLGESRPIDSGYAVGYGTSKWAGEVLLREIAERCGVPVDVFRCSMIMPPREDAGQVNAGDFLTRLWIGILTTGLAPRSFYADGPAGHHFDGLPVDFVADAIAAIALARRSASPSARYRTYHVVDAHRDDVSLDTMVDWMVSAGYRVTRVEDHAAWYRAFRDKLEALPPAEKQRSPLPILHQWREPIGEGEVTFDASRLREKIREIEGETEIPRITEAYLHKCLRDLELLGLVQKRR
jgi:fatty acid CoA ligase FadD9